MYDTDTHGSMILIVVLIVVLVDYDTFSFFGVFDIMWMIDLIVDWIVL